MHACLTWVARSQRRAARQIKILPVLIKISGPVFQRPDLLLLVRIFSFIGHIKSEQTPATFGQQIHSDFRRMCSHDFHVIRRFLLYLQTYRTWMPAVRALPFGICHLPFDANKTDNESNGVRALEHGERIFISDTCGTAMPMCLRFMYNLLLANAFLIRIRTLGWAIIFAFPIN